MNLDRPSVLKSGEHCWLSKERHRASRASQMFSQMPAMHFAQHIVRNTVRRYGHLCQSIFFPIPTLPAPPLWHLPHVFCWLVRPCRSYMSPVTITSMSRGLCMQVGRPRVHAARELLWVGEALPGSQRCGKRIWIVRAAVWTRKIKAIYESRKAHMDEGWRALCEVHITYSSYSLSHAI